MKPLIFLAGLSLTLSTSTAIAAGPCDGPWNGLIEPGDVGRNQRGIFWKFSNPLGNHIVQSATRIMLEMPFGRYNFCDEIFQLVLVRNQLCKKMP